jgi:hypothetical protein
MLEAAQKSPVPRTKAAALRYVLECVENGYHHHATGRLPAAKVAAFVAKMADLYAIHATRGARAWARHKGRACTRLVLFPLTDESGDWLFFLLATEGAGPVHDQQSLGDARKPAELVRWCEQYKDGSVRPQYELVGRPVRARKGATHRWTWAMTESCYAVMKNWIDVGAQRVRSSGEKNPARLVAAVDALRKMPGFKGVREQKRRLILEADIPKTYAPSLTAPEIGGYVDKHLPVFEKNRTVASLLAGACTAV